MESLGNVNVVLVWCPWVTRGRRVARNDEVSVGVTLYVDTLYTRPFLNMIWWQSRSLFDVVIRQDIKTYFKYWKGSFSNDQSFNVFLLFYTYFKILLKNM